MKSSNSRVEPSESGPAHGIGRGTAIRRFAGLACFVVFLAGFKLGPVQFGFQEAAHVAWLVVFQVVGLVVTTGLSFYASRRGAEDARPAWRCFAIGHLLYLCGNLYGTYMVLTEQREVFPSVRETVYFMMAAAFAVGMAQYGEVSRKITRTAVYNFFLVYSAITVACLFLLREHLERSVLTNFGTLAAFLYPALWFSVAAFGVMSLAIYHHGRRLFPLQLMVGCVSAEAIADLAYAKEVIDGTYSMGGATELLWVASIGLAIWAVVEHLAVGTPKATGRSSRRSYTPIAMACLPGLAILVFMVSGSYTGAFGEHPFYVGFSVVLGMAFATVAALREHSIIDAHCKLSKAAAEGQRRVLDVLESTSDSVLVLDADWKVGYFNGSAERVFANQGRTLSLGMPMWSTADRKAFPGRHILVGALAEGREAGFEDAFGDLWLDVRAFPKGDGVSIFFRDVSEPRRARLEIEHLALRDPLTGLANRTSFHRNLNQKLSTKQDVGILILDLDHFKEINDTRGHPVGDEVLRIVSSRLLECVSGTMSVARLGGDEFAVVLSDLSQAEAAALAKRINEVLAEPMTVDGTVLRVGASIGVALGNRVVDADILLRNADIALYEVKNSGRGGYAFFQKAMETLLLERNGMKQDLASALENDEFELYYQPLVDLASGKVCSFEALLRWNHPQRGLMPPDTFIPLIEETGLIVPIGAWVMRTACKQARSWPSDISVAVNISTRQFFDHALVDTVKSALADAELSADRLELEITESAFLNDSGENLETLASIRALGHKIALDDFGTGYSSLGYLHKFKFDKLKIDKSFVEGLNNNNEREAIVRAVISLGETLNMVITAEGVETSEQYEWLRDNCQQAQGHFISVPLPAPRIGAFLKDFERHPVKTGGRLPARPGDGFSEKGPEKPYCQ